jgi:hypothetical protein
MRVRVKFEGLSMFVRHTGTPVVTVLLPNADNVLEKHLDGKDAYPHFAVLLVPETNLRAVSNGQSGSLIVTDKGRYFGFSMRDVDLAFDPPLASVAQVPTERMLKAGLGSVVQLPDVGTDLVLDPDVALLVNNADLSKVPNPTPKVIGRVRLETGHFETLDIETGGGFFRFSNSLQGPGGRRETIARDAFWIAQNTAPQIDIVMKNMKGVEQYRITVGADKTDEFEIRVGNACLHPKNWDSNMDCQAELEQRKANLQTTFDLDFKWYYKLLNSSLPASIHARLLGKELPVPEFVPGGLESPSGDTCGKLVMDHP